MDDKKKDRRRQMQGSKKRKKEIRYFIPGTLLPALVAILPFNARETMQKCMYAKTSKHKKMPLYRGRIKLQGSKATKQGTRSTVIANFVEMPSQGPNL
jgi:hypothetical protein